jgi:hypothetical protein
LVAGASAETEGRAGDFGSHRQLGGEQLDDVQALPWAINGCLSPAFPVPFFRNFGVLHHLLCPMNIQ